MHLRLLLKSSEAKHPERVEVPMRVSVCLAMLSLVLIGHSAIAYPGDEIYAVPGKRVDIGGRALNLYCFGNGSPTVILESGLGGRASAWAQVQPALAKKTRVCSYDRGGYAFSDSAPAPRTATRLAEELHTALHRAGERQPYLLVGSTFGAFVVRLFAGRFPHEVAGMVLLNPSPEDEELTRASPTVERIDREGLAHAAACRDHARRGELNAGGARVADCLPPPNRQLSPKLNAARSVMLRRPNTWAALVGEWQTIRESAAEVKAARGKRFGFPLVVVSAAREGEYDGPAQDKAAMHQAWLHWAAWQRDIVKLSPDNLHLLANGSDRNAESSTPRLVISAIETVVAAARARIQLQR